MLKKEDFDMQQSCKAVVQYDFFFFMMNAVGQEGRRGEIAAHLLRELNFYQVIHCSVLHSHTALQKLTGFASSHRFVTLLFYGSVISIDC